MAVKDRNITVSRLLTRKHQFLRCTPRITCFSVGLADWEMLPSHAKNMAADWHRKFSFRKMFLSGCDADVSGQNIRTTIHWCPRDFQRCHQKQWYLKIFVPSPTSNNLGQPALAAVLTHFPHPRNLGWERQKMTRERYPRPSAISSAARTTSFDTEKQWQVGQIN